MSQQEAPMTKRLIAAFTVATTTIMVAGTHVIAQSSHSQGSNSQSANSQGSNPQGPGSPETAQMFVQHMLAANQAEVQMGEMAMTRAASAQVKSFAQMMVMDHSQNNQQLQPIAQQVGVTAAPAPDAQHKAIADRLARLQGADFDREFMNAM